MSSLSIVVERQAEGVPSTLVALLLVACSSHWMSVYSLIQVQGFLLAAFITRKHVRMDSQELVLVKDDQHSVLRYGLVLILLADDDARWQAAHG